jgi:hypothetical protein
MSIRLQQDVGAAMGRAEAPSETGDFHSLGENAPIPTRAQRANAPVVERRADRLIGDAGATEEPPPRPLWDSATPSGASNFFGRVIFDGVGHGARPGKPNDDTA